MILVKDCPVAVLKGAYQWTMLVAITFFFFFHKNQDEGPNQVGKLEFLLFLPEYPE